MIVRAGRRYINLDYLIDAEDGMPTPGRIRIHLIPGRQVDLTPEESRDLRAALDDLPKDSGGFQGKPTRPVSGGQDSP